MSPLAPRTVAVPVRGGSLVADLSVPERSTAIVLFAHGSGSGRASPRNRAVADALERRGFATLLVDLLTADEAREDERTMVYRFQIPLLGQRLVDAVDWLETEVALRAFEVGLYGASTGGAAALLAAAARADRVHALVLRGARSDLAGEVLPLVKAPVLQIVGGRDPPILEIARETDRALRCPHSTTIVPNATHLFEEPGALEDVTRHTLSWFERYLAPRRVSV